VLATCDDGSGQVANFVATPGPGVEIVETWDSLGMRATGSHDVLLTDVFVPVAMQIPAAAGPAELPKPNAWFPLTVSAVYLGVAAAALTCAARYAYTRVPTALGKPIATLETIQHRLGQAEFLLHQARGQLYHTAELWERHADRRDDLEPAIMVAKLTATNNAVAIVDHCMRAVGGASMSKTLPFERYYRDVRGGLSHPVHDDPAYILLGQQALARHAPP
jgi:alkylation response protein AidB-like acyl-CoA dehydrogenase